MMRYFFCFIMTLIASGMSLTAVAEEQPQAVMNLMPAKCVSLKQGQPCYADIEISWQTPEPVSVCLVRMDTRQELSCWRSTAQGDFSSEIITRESLSLSLLTDTGEMLATTELAVAWVYKKRRSPTSWRVF